MIEWDFSPQQESRRAGNDNNGELAVCDCLLSSSGDFIEGVRKRKIPYISNMVPPLKMHSSKLFFKALELQMSSSQM